MILMSQGNELGLYSTSEYLSVVQENFLLCYHFRLVAVAQVEVGDGGNAAWQGQRRRRRLWIQNHVYAYIKNQLYNNTW